MKNKLTSVVLSILLHLGLAGALVYAYSQKPEPTETVQAITVSLVAAPQPKVIAEPAPEPVSEPIKEVVQVTPSPTPKPKPAPKKVVAKASPKVVSTVVKSKPVIKKKTVTTPKKELQVSQPKKKTRNAEEEKWAELLQPVKASKPKPVTTYKAGSTTSNKSRQTKVAATQSRPRQPSRPTAKPVVKKVVPSPQTKQAEGNYKQRLHSLIERQKKYPARAKRRGDEGIVVISFVVSANGQINNVKVKKSSGSRILDNSAMNTVKKVSGKLPFTAGIKKRQLSFNVPLSYQIR